jgi:hypothetical protein
MSASSSAVKALVTDPISKMVRGPAPPNPPRIVSPSRTTA